MPDPDQPEVPARYDCETCQHGKASIGLSPMSLEQRRYMHCGYLEESEWLTAKTGDGNLSVPKRIGASRGMEPPGVEWAVEDLSTGDIFPNICPGWPTRLPLIAECAKAFKAFDKGAMSTMFPDVSNQVAEGVMELSRAFDEFSRQQIAKSTKEAERNG